MRFFFVFVFALCANNLCLSQDTIQLKNGLLIEAKILEISSTTVKYYRFSQPNGPLRILELFEISKIKYADGTLEKYNIAAPIVKSAPSAEPEIKPYRDPFFKRGFFIDRMYGFSHQRSSYLAYQIMPEFPNGTFLPVREITNHFSVGLKIGNKWYFGKNETWKLGLQTTWVRLASLFGGGESGGIITVANIGVCSVIKRSEKRAFEANLQFGPSVVLTSNGAPGLSISLEGKYRIKKFAVGLDYQFISFSDNQANYGENLKGSLNSICLTAGFKF